MFISFVLIQKKRTKEKIKTSTGCTVFVDQSSMTLCGSISFYNTPFMFISFVLIQKK
ncbi:MAG: hypothetical protein J7K51_09205 [Thermotogae bacterium]|nr:hypothetical protein [Thermotogota bacterium]